ncbi:lipase family protein [Mycobacterium sp. NPDC006124]|uniref:lipase family protein n=1 Tax=Mycobacterium sp. NPDC006124 TaxID=3156729 RepID=UPI0033BB3243
MALTDYQGLGSEGVHPYTDAKTAGLNMIDAVRALRWTFGDVSNRWAAIGASQGGGAAWAADEQASAYAPDMELVGALAISPAADVSRLVEKAQAGTLTPDQRPAFQAIIESLAKLHLDINRDDFRSGSAARNWDILSACSGPDVLKRNAAAEALGPSDLKPRSSKAAQQIQNYLSKWALPQQRLSAPLFVWYSGMDTLIDAEWTRASIEKACQLGGDVQWKFEADKGHGETDVGGLLPWVVDRFAGKPAGDDCA